MARERGRAVGRAAVERGRRARLHGRPRRARAAVLAQRRGDRRRRERTRSRAPAAFAAIDVGECGVFPALSAKAGAFACNFGEDPARAACSRLPAGYSPVVPRAARALEPPTPRGSRETAARKIPVLLAARARELSPGAPVRFEEPASETRAAHAEVIAKRLEAATCARA